MKEFEWKNIIPYAPLPVLLLLLALWKWGSIAPTELLLRELLTVFGYIASVGDIRSKRIPNRLVGAMLGAWVLVIVPHLFFQTQRALFAVLDGALGFLLAGAVFLLVYLISRKGLGGGDVKLMAVSGLYLGFDAVLPAMLYGSLLAALTGGVLILFKKIKPSDSIPLAPFLYVGMLLTMFIR